MTTSTEFDSFLPVYDAVPEDWEDAKPFLVEQLKRISNVVNTHEIGFFLDEELLSGKQFIPGVAQSPANSTPLQFRSVLRKVIVFGPLVMGLNTHAHGITVDANFTLIQLFASATNTGSLTAEPIPNGADTLSMDATNIYITVAATWTYALAVCEYIQEL